MEPLIQNDILLLSKNYSGKTKGGGGIDPESQNCYNRDQTSASSSSGYRYSKITLQSAIIRGQILG